MNPLLTLAYSAGYTLVLLIGVGVIRSLRTDSGKTDPGNWNIEVAFILAYTLICVTLLFIL